MSSWLDEIIRQHQDFESPLNFWRWSALAAISAVVKDNIWLDRYLYKLYPNIYVMLHAESGLKKGPPVSMASQLVKAVGGSTIIEGRASIQGILKKMGTSQSLPGGKIESNSRIFICSSELTSSLVDDPVATRILTDLYDRHYNVGDWESLLKMENFTLKKPTVTMLTATNEAMSQSFFNHSAIQGGYVARTFIIHEHQRNKKNSLAFPPVSLPDNKANSIYLKELAKLNGPFQDLGVLESSDIHRYSKQKDGREIFFSESGIIYDNWYDNFTETLDENQFKDNTGTLNRFGDSVIKVAMILSLSRKAELIIDPESMTEAISICESLVGNVRRATLGKSGQNQSDGNAERKTLFINELMARDTHSISRMQLNKKYWIQGNVSEWDEIALSMEAAGMIKIDTIGNQIIYRMPDTEYQKMDRFLRGKNL